MKPFQPNHRLDDIISTFRSGKLPDDVSFDKFIKSGAGPSQLHWTPVGVAFTVASWLKEFGASSLVDIGSGVGKLCVAAAMSGDSTFIGIEQRPHLVSVARELAKTYDVEPRVSFIEGVFGEVDTPSASAYYFYNPFGENIISRDMHIDETVELTKARYAREVSYAKQFIEDVPSGTLIITYNGFGGVMPEKLKQLKMDRSHIVPLRLFCQL